MTAACACAAFAGPGAPAAADPALADIVLHLPGIHCAACIAGAETALARVPGVLSARVNLGQRRAYVVTDGRADPADLCPTLCAALDRAGIAARELDAAGLDGAADPEGRALLLRIGVAGFAMMNVMLLSVAVWSGVEGATRQLFHLLSAAIAVPAVIFAARPFFAGALAGLRAGRLGMDVPIALAIALATGLSVYEALAGGRHAWFDAALSLTFFLLAGRYLDRACRRAARSAAAELTALEVPRATRLTAGGDERVASAGLRPGDLIRVRPGGRFPADGTIVEGATDIDRSAMTGESAPAPAGPGDPVRAGETSLSGALVIRVERAGRDTALARLAALVGTAETARSRAASLADRAAAVYAPVVHILAAAAFAGWLAATGDAYRALGVAVAVLIITCPCALGLAVPAVSVAASGRLYRAGLLVTSDTALERMAQIDCVVFDKTGTLTTGAPEVDAAPDDAALAVAMGLAAGSDHPFSRAILAHGAGRGLSAAPVEARREHPGRGVEGLWRGAPVRLGQPGWCGLGRGAGAEVALALPGRAPARITFREVLAPGAAQAVGELEALGCEVGLLSGDAPPAARRIAAAAGIGRAEGGLDPAAKVARLAALAGAGRRVLMVGDGLNDAGALAAAAASMAPGTGLDAARNAADVVLLAPALTGVPLTLAVARKAARLMRQNLWMSVLYNLVAVPLALAGVATPLMAAIAMSVSSVSVGLNALRAAR